MASKKIQVTSELTTEKEWREFLHQPGLLVVDLYRDWAGPCVAMSTPLKALKVSEAAFQWMHIASAPSSIVPELRRLEGSCPTFVLLSGGRLVNVIYGCNAPEVIREISEEVEREKRAAQGLEGRRTVSLTRLSPAEAARQALLLGSEGERLREERSRAELEADRALRRVLGQIAEHLPAATVVVVFPYALQSDECGEILDSLRRSWAEMGFAVTREEQVEMTREAVDLMFWERRLPQHDVLADSVMEGASLVLMLERQVGEEDLQDEDEEEDEDQYALDVEPAVAKSIYGFLPGTGSSMELITPAGSVTPACKEEAEGEAADGEYGEGLEAVEEGGEGQEVRATEAADGDEGEDLAEDEGVGAAQAQEGEEREGDEREGEEKGEEAALEPGQLSLKDREDEDGEADEGFGDAEEDIDDAVVPPVDEEDEEQIPQVPVRVWNPRELLPALDSAAARLLFRRDEGGPGGAVLPGIWTPLTALSKAAAVKALFEDVAEPLYEPPTPPPPPPPETTVICFAGDKRDEVLGLSASFPSEITRWGFFTKSRKLLASTHADYERLVRSGLQTAKTLVVLEVARTHSAPLLELAAAGPLYVSATPGIAKADVDEFFGAKVARANQDELREIVKIQEPEEGPAAPQAPAKARTEGDGEEGDEAGEGPGQADGEDGGEGEAAADQEGAEASSGLRASQGLGDGEAVPEAAPEDEDAVLAAEVAAEATWADVAAEEQLFAGTGEGDAPPTALETAEAAVHDGAPPAGE